MHRLTSHFDKEETISRVLLLHNELLKKVDGCGRSFANALQNVTTPELSQEAQQASKGNNKQQTQNKQNTQMFAFITFHSQYINKVINTSIAIVSLRVQSLISNSSCMIVCTFTIIKVSREMFYEIVKDKRNRPSRCTFFYHAAADPPPSEYCVLAPECIEVLSEFLAEASDEYSERCIADCAEYSDRPSVCSECIADCAEDLPEEAVEYLLDERVENCERPPSDSATAFPEDAAEIPLDDWTENFPEATPEAVENFEPLPAPDFPEPSTEYFFDDDCPEEFPRDNTENAFTWLAAAAALPKAAEYLELLVLEAKE